MSPKCLSQPSPPASPQLTSPFSHTRSLPANCPEEDMEQDRTTQKLWGQPGNLRQRGTPTESIRGEQPCSLQAPARGSMHPPSLQRLQGPLAMCHHGHSGKGGCSLDPDPDGALHAGTCRLCRPQLCVRGDEPTPQPTPAHIAPSGCHAVQSKWECSTATFHGNQ